MDNPKISVITPSYNTGKFISQNIMSVFDQTYKHFEHIIIDNCSTDNTCEILTHFSHLKWISEQDNGQSDAYNKGISLATGEYVLFLNSDDYLLSNNVFSEFILLQEKNTKREQYSAFMGNVSVVNISGNKLDKMSNRNRDYTFNDLLNELPIIIHPATFFRRDIIAQTTGYSNDLHFVMDYDFFLKVTIKLPINSVNLDVSALRRHESCKGESPTNWKFSSEFIKVRSKYGGLFFSKLSIQPIKVLFFHFIIGAALLQRLRKNKIARYISAKVGISKINSLVWYDNKN